jgi:AcrR family transcriptional regulator
MKQVQESAQVVGGKISRTGQSRAAVLKAATALLNERGPGAFTIDAVVERSGVAKTTIYRHWPSRSDLLMATIGHQIGEPTVIPDTGSLRGDLLGFLLTRVHAMNSNDLLSQRMNSLPGIIDAAKRNPDLAAVGMQVLHGELKALRPIFERGRQRGEVRHDRDIEAMTHVLLGALFIHVGLEFANTDTYITEVVDTVLEGVIPRAAKSAARPALVDAASVAAKKAVSKVAPKSKAKPKSR